MCPDHDDGDERVEFGPDHPSTLTSRGKPRPRPARSGVAGRSERVAPPPGPIP